MSEELKTLDGVRKMIDERMEWGPKDAAGDPHYSLVQTYLLLKILDKLESIGDTLTTIGNDLWNDHHNK